MLSKVFSRVFGKNKKSNQNRNPLKPKRTLLGVEYLDSRIAPASDMTLQFFDGGNTPALTLAVNHFSFGGSDPAIRWNVFGGIPARTQMETLKVSIDMDGSSPALFGKMTTGNNFTKAILSQQVSDQKSILTHTAWVMGKVFINSIQDSGFEEERPTENLEIAFGEVTIANSQSATFYDIPRNESKAVGVPKDFKFAPLQETKSPSTLTLTVSDKSNNYVINLDSFKFGAKNTNKLWVPGNPSNWKGDVTFDTLEVSTNQISNNYPALFSALVKGTKFETVTLTQSVFSQSKDGKEALLPVASWVMGTVYLTGNKVEGTADEGLPTETLSFDFGKVTVANKTSNTSWAQMTNTFSGPAIPRDLKFTDPLLPTGNEEISLQLAGKNLTTVTLDVDAYQFGFSKSVGISAKGNSFDVGKVNFQSLSVTTQLNRFSPDLFKLLTSGGQYETATLVQNRLDGSGKPQPIAAWKMGSVIVSSATVEGDSDSILPTENFQFTFGSITEANKATRQSWNVTSNKNTGPDLGGLKFEPLQDSKSTTLLTLSLNGASDKSKDISLNLNHFNFGVDYLNSGKTSFQTLQVSTLFNDNSPLLFKAIASEINYQTATLTQSVSKDGKLVPVASWVLGTVHGTEREIVGNPGNLPKESLSFTFGSVTVVNDKSKSSWNQTTNKPTGPTAPSGDKFGASQVPSGKGLISIELAGEKLPTISLDVSSFRFGFKSEGISLKDARPVGKANFETLTVSTSLNLFSPDLFKALTSGMSYTTATLIQRSNWDRDGLQPIAAWKMGKVKITQNIVTGGTEGIPSETLQFSFSSITQANETSTQSWDISSRTPTGPSISPNLFPRAIPGSGNGAQFLSLTLEEDSGKTTTIDLDSFTFGGGRGQLDMTKGIQDIGKVAFQNLEVSASGLSNAPFRFKSLVNGTPFKSVNLTKARVDNNGKLVPVTSWLLGKSYLILDTTEAIVGEAPDHGMKFLFQSVTVANATGAASWDQVSNKATGPNAPAKSTFGSW